MKTREAPHLISWIKILTKSMTGHLIHAPHVDQVCSTVKVHDLRQDFRIEGEN